MLPVSDHRSPLAFQDLHAHTHTHTRYVYNFLSNRSIATVVYMCARFLQMDLPQRFRDMTNSQVVTLASLQVGYKYRIRHVQRVKTRFGETVLAHLTDVSDAAIKVYLPERYAAVFTDADLEDIARGRVTLHLVYNGRSATSSAHMISIE